jgi:hypothetical protein
MARTTAGTSKTASANQAALQHNRFAGTYSFRFAGFGLGPQSESFHLVGVGQMHLNVAGTLSGTLYSSECPITTGAGGPSSVFEYETFQLAGTYAISAHGSGTVSIDFVQKGNVVEQDVFRVAPGDAAMTRFWLISTHPTVGGTLVPELVSGEAVRLY